MMEYWGQAVLVSEEENGEAGPRVAPLQGVQESPEDIFLGFVQLVVLTFFHLPG